MRSLKTLLLGGVSLAVLTAPALAQSDPFAGFVPVTDEMIQNPDDEDWISWRRTVNNWGYSPLDQINRDNAGSLTHVWSRSMEDGFQEATPVVYDGIMFLPHPNDVVQALDATTGDLLWEYRRQLPDDVGGIMATRGLGLWQDRVILMSKDNVMVALDATSGEVIWETAVRAPDGGIQTSTVTVANGVAVSGRSCFTAENCFVAAHDLETGEELWRFYTLPQEGQPGSETWGDVPMEARRHVGSWAAAPAFDPELNMIYIGTSVTNPYPKFFFADIEDIDNEFLYQTSTLALNAETGELVWYQQHIRDQWDLDHPFERIILDTAIAPNPDEVRWINPNVTPGEERQVLTGIPGKTGIFYSIDRLTGEFLWARETTYQNVVLDIDPSNGRATMNAELFPTETGQQFLVCPAAGGGKDWMAGAYSPDTNAIYYPLQNFCMDSVVTDTDIELTPFVMAPGEENAGTIQAVSVETGELLWKFETRAAAMSSVLATGGGLIFQGDYNRRFRALDDTTGEVLWETIVASQVGGYPISYAVDGRQYVAIPVGATLISGGYYAPVTPELRPGSSGNSIYVFALPES
ncbi:MAG: PQQ-binding-like beta-propeller repeat protein [Bauldia sp.]|nr:PQQ-binding-like beta-propeller repeat protein [Bauldia sp.]